MLLGQRGAGGGCSPPVRHKRSQFQRGKGAQALRGGKAKAVSEGMLLPGQLGAGSRAAPTGVQGLLGLIMRSYGML